MSETVPARGVPDWRPSISIVDHIVVDDEGRLQLFGNQSSGVLSSAAWADGLVELAPGATVEPGQTLSEIATTELAGLPTAEAVTRIQVANNLSTTHVHAGQTLTIPGH